MIVAGNRFGSVGFWNLDHEIKKEEEEDDMMMTESTGIVLIRVPFAGFQFIHIAYQR